MGSAPGQTIFLVVLAAELRGFHAVDGRARLLVVRGDVAHFERIAREAGVGSGTLYRNFPTREALIEAAYRNELARLCGSAAELLQTMPADVALRTWMDRFIDYLATKHGMADALRAVIASGGDPFAQSRASLLAAITTLLAAGAADAKLRRDIAPADVLASLSGVSLIAGAPEQRDQAGRLLDLLLDGLRHTR
jgi:AcrR family transcriptional regulator